MIMTNQHQHQDCEEDLIIAQFYSYCFQSLIGLANLISVISCYKFHNYLKD